jgi:hypothetical protein
MRVSGDCISPHFHHGHAVWFDKNEPVAAVPAVSGGQAIFS